MWQTESSLVYVRLRICTRHQPSAWAATTVRVSNEMQVSQANRNSLSTGDPENSGFNRMQLRERHECLVCRYKDRGGELTLKNIAGPRASCPETAVETWL